MSCNLLRVLTFSLTIAAFAIVQVATAQSWLSPLSQAVNQTENGKSVKTDLFDKGVRYFETVGTRDDLPDMVVSAITQDDKGFLWLGTPAGLIRYDGYNFKNFTPTKTESVGNIYSLWAAPDDKVWIGTQSNGLYVLSPKHETLIQYQHDVNDPHSLSDNYVRAIAGDSKGGIWIGTNMGLSYLTPSGDKFIPSLPNNKHFAKQKNQKVHALEIDELNNLWVATYNGLFYVETESRTWHSIYGVERDINSEDRIEFRTLFRANNGTLWFGTATHGAGWYDPVTKKVSWIGETEAQRSRLKYTWVTDIVQPTKDEIWLATTSKGIYVANAETGVITDHFEHDSGVESTINNNNIDTLYVDNSGLVWIGSWGGGLNSYNPANFAIRSLRHSYVSQSIISHPNINAIIELTNGDIWISTRGNGIDIYSPELGTSHHFHAEKSEDFIFGDTTIMSLEQTDEDSVWIGTMHSGLYRYTLSTGAVKHFGVYQELLDDHVRTLRKSQDGGLWIGTDDGLNKWFPNQEKLVKYQTKSGQQNHFDSAITSITETPDGRVWLGSFDGLYSIAPNSTLLQRVIVDSQFEDENNRLLVAGLMLDSKNQLWVASTKETYRLNNWQSDEFIFESISKKVGLKISLGENMVEDALGQVWTEDHIINTQSWQVRALGSADGIRIGTKWWGSFTKLIDGTLAFGGSKGVILIKPELFKDWDFMPPVNIIKLTINGKNAPTAQLENFELTPEAKSFSIEFASLDFSSPVENSYMYKLVGYDSEWIFADAKNRVATYTNLDPGHYILQIRGTNRLGQWSDDEITIAITQLPAWYQTFGFYVIVVFSIIVGLIGIYRVRFAQLRARKAEMETVILQRTIELKEKNSALEKALQELEHLSVSDQLTGLYNRHYIAKYLPKEQAQIFRNFYQEPDERRCSYNKDLGFLLLDIDHFKKINDTYGHDAGDKVLVQVADIISTTCREADWIVRWGGEEFLVICRKTDRELLLPLAERIRSNIENHQFIIDDETKISVTTSIGLVAFPFFAKSISCLTWQQTLQLADSALYNVKQGERNGCIYLKDNRESDDEALNLKNYQSIVDNVFASVGHGLIQLEKTPPC